MRSADPVVYVLRYWPTLTETFVYREITELVRTGVPVAVIAIGPRADGRLQDQLPDVPVWRVPRGLALLGAWRGRSKAATRLDAATRWLRALRPARLHAHFAGEAALLARALAERVGVPWSVTVHAVDLFKPIPGFARLLAEARPVIAVCEHHRVWLARHWGVDARVVRCGVSLDVPRADPGREPASVVAVARDVPKKDLARLVRATRALAAPLRIIGDATRFSGPGVEVGPLPPSAVPAALARASVFALPVRVAPDGDRDGVPVSMLEAMAAGLPVVTRPIAGVPELVDATVGWCELDFERALSEALSRTDERVRRGEAARARADAWCEEAGANVLIAAWAGAAC